MQWREVEAWANDKLVQARQQNDGDLGDSDTAKLRGRIALLKELIALPDTKRVLDAQLKSVSPE